MHPHCRRAVSDQRRRGSPRAGTRRLLVQYRAPCHGAQQRGTELVGVSMKAQAMALAVAGLCGLMQAAVACEIMGMPSW